jgi:hypothetical protein
MEKRENLSEGEEMLGRILEECLEEEISFVPPERELARTHHFSKAFEQAMNRLLEQSEQETKKQHIRKHFQPRYGQWAACVLVFLICGILFYSVLSPLRKNSGATSSDMDMAAATTETTEATADDAEAESEEVVAEEEEAAPAESAEDAGQEDLPLLRYYCGAAVQLASDQEVPETLGEVTTLVNCPVLDENRPMVYLTIGNTGEESVKYWDQYELQVLIDGGWYVIPPATSSEGGWQELEAGMAVDEEIDLTAYEMEYESEQYRLIVQMEDGPVSAEFTFRETFSEQMEQLEAEEASGE